MVGQRLREAIEGVEGVAGEGRGHDPLVVRLVEVLVDAWVVEVTMNPVDAEVGEDEKDGELEEVVPKSWTLLGGVVELAVASNLEPHERSCGQRHEGHGLVGLDDFEPDLVLDEFGVVHGALVEDQEIGERSEDEVNGEAEDPVEAV